MAKKRTPDQLTEKASPILIPYLSGQKWCEEIFFNMVESAKQMKPNKAYGAAYSLCLLSGLDQSTAGHFASACKFLAVLRLEFEERFYNAIGEESQI